MNQKMEGGLNIYQFQAWDDLIDLLLNNRKWKNIIWSYYEAFMTQSLKLTQFK